MKLDEADTWAKLATPALHRRGRTKGPIRVKCERPALTYIAVVVDIYSLGHLFYAF